MLLKHNSVASYRDTTKKSPHKALSSDLALPIKNAYHFETDTIFTYPSPQGTPPHADPENDTQKQNQRFLRVSSSFHIQYTVLCC